MIIRSRGERAPIGPSPTYVRAYVLAIPDRRTTLRLLARWTNVASLPSLHGYLARLGSRRDDLREYTTEALALESRQDLSTAIVRLASVALSSARSPESEGLALLVVAASLCPSCFAPARQPAVSHRGRRFH